MSSSERVAVTLGDPSGIGPEIAVEAVASLAATVRGRVTIFCDGPVLDRALASRGQTRAALDGSEIVDRGQLSCDQAPLGRPTTAGGRAQVAYLQAAVSAARAGVVGGLVTAPISKTQAQAAGFAFPGHTEMLAAELGGPVAMMFAGPRLRVALATIHEPLARVPSLLTVDGIATTVALVADSLRRDFGHATPTIGVVGLNPHAGEGGLFGREEQEIIAPAIEAARRTLGERAAVIGPLVPDAAFRNALDGGCDALVAMYHDQGLIPVKLVDFEDAVNVTLGLPVVRTSPDHGVAYDIAGKGVARAGSFRAALALALEMTARRARLA